MLKLKKVAVTGGLASGKSTVCQFFKELGAYVVSADSIVHHLLTPDQDVGKKVIELLGREIIVDGNIDRERVARKVFNHPGKLKQLETVIHPPVLQEILEEGKKAEKEGFTLFVVEVPLLYEVGWEAHFDHVLTVAANEEECWKRFRSKTGYGREEFDSRMRRQLPPVVKEKKSHLTIQNEGSREELYNQVKNLYQQLTT